MTPDDLAAVLGGMPHATVDEPFAEGVPVYKVAGKVFAIFQQHASPPDVTLKCDPELARQLREQYRSVVPGYHVNKRLWNTISLDGDVPDDDLLDLVHHSYEQVVAGLPARTRAALQSGS
ncbi:MmcQ/YjbR family DNA-binding protein [Pseudonocardia adelaidensis]|uniref:MmcQ/YjbR family DNA-binding protein n=1 Tax=Pseudonocardia adelaidensis TaxID=648754 RepID=A0ABP9NJ18_9PSEU